MIGYNMFAYCNNNPVMYFDPIGHAPKWLENIGNYLNRIFNIYTQQQTTNDMIRQKQIEMAENLIEDCQRFNLQNTDENSVLESHFFSAYKGKLVIRIIDSNVGFSFGVIFLGTENCSAIDIRHEYGHTVQFESYGTIGYIYAVAIPSVTNYWIDYYNRLPYDYYSYPWEKEADIFGELNRSISNPLPKEKYDQLYNFMSMFGW